MEKIKATNVEKTKKLKAMYEDLDYNGVVEYSSVLLDEFYGNNYNEGIIEINLVLSNLYFNKCDYSKALFHALEVSECLEKTDSISSALDNTINFAKILIQTQSFEEAIKLLKTGLKKANIYKEDKHTAQIFNLIGKAYMNLKQYKAAEDNFTNALDIATKLNERDTINHTKINITQLNISKGVFNIAKTFLDDVYVSAKKENQSITLVWCDLLKANLAFEKKNYEEAIMYAKKAETLSDGYGLYYELSKAYQWSYLAHAKQKQYQEAFDIANKYIELQNHLNHKEKEKELIKMKIKYDCHLYQKEIKKLQTDLRKVTQQRQQLQDVMDVLGKQNEELLYLATNDFLTGAFNRKYFMFKFEEEFSIAQEHRTDISCIVFDIDRFKGINDSYGHLAGDEILKHIVRICERKTESTDIIGRFGGDEYVIILVGKNLEAATELGNELIKTVEASPASVGDKSIRVTLSIGVTDNIVNNPNNAEDMIRIADIALYKAKEEGRNRLCSSKNIF